MAKCHYLTLNRCVLYISDPSCKIVYYAPMDEKNLTVVHPVKNILFKYKICSLILHVFSRLINC